MAMGHADRLGGEGEDLLGQLEPAPGGSGGIRQQRGGGRRAIDEREHLLLPELHALSKVVEERCQSGDLAGPSLPGQADLGQALTLQHGSHGGGELGRGGGMPLDVIGQPREDDPAHDPLGQGGAEGDRRSMRRAAGLALALLGVQPPVGMLAIAAGDAVDRELRIAFEQIEKLPAGSRHPGQRRGGEAGSFALPGDAPEIGQSEVGAGSEAERHRDSPEDRTARI